MRTSNSAPYQVRDVIAAFPYRTTDLPIQLPGITERELRFPTDNLRVTSIVRRNLIMATESELPTLVTQSLEKRFGSMEYEVKTLAPIELLNQMRSTTSASR